MFFKSLVNFNKDLLILAIINSPGVFWSEFPQLLLCHHSFEELIDITNVQLKTVSIQ